MSDRLSVSALLESPTPDVALYPRSYPTVFPQDSFPLPTISITACKRQNLERSQSEYSRLQNILKIPQDAKSRNALPSTA